MCMMFSCGKEQTNDNSKATSDVVINSAESVVVSMENTEESGMKISVELPEGWTKNEDSILEHQYMKNTASFMIKSEAYESDTVDGIADEGTEWLKNAFTGYTEVGERENIQVGGKDAIKVTFTCTVGSFEIEYTYVFLFLNNEAYTILFSDLASTFNDLADDYSYILEHISFAE